MSIANMPTSTGGNLNCGRPRACVHLNPAPHYRKDAFEAGLEAHGFTIEQRPDPAPSAGDVLVLWNRYARDEAHARRYEAAKATVLIVENAWLGPDVKPQTTFALCRGHHNGAGEWHVGEEPRPIDWPIMPWRTDGKHVLIIPQRGMGEEGVRMPRGWPAHAEALLHRATGRPIKVRGHPGIRPHPPMDFEDCWAAVTWASGGALKAICAGIPVFYEMRHWIGSPAARFGIDGIETPFLGDRGPMLHRLSWAQWTADEIAKGEPFQWLLKS